MLRTMPGTKPEGRPAVEAWLTRVKPELQPIAYRIDALIQEALPNVVCAVKWNVPFYGSRGHGWIASINSFNAHVKLLFFDGPKLTPTLPVGKGNNAIDYRSLEELNEKQVKAWLKQAKQLPGWLKAE
ncbi:MAG: DUF1801 domain-containing protein [Flavobacteriales bacterium]|nr:DUF1801 domain-containing protein [Flavobacteriales bacterium]MCC6937649.1 DUF1801 domain-containing protein [Flavobacteriales bacterium]